MKEFLGKGFLQNASELFTQTTSAHIQERRRIDKVVFRVYITRKAEIPEKQI